MTFSVNMKETLSDFMCSSRRAAALICALVIDNVLLIAIIFNKLK